MEGSKISNPNDERSVAHHRPRAMFSFIEFKACVLILKRVLGINHAAAVSFSASFWNSVRMSW